ncbi:MAG: hypothetical protein ACYCOR_13550 [Acidobacteriaceae bacterium]
MQIESFQQLPLQQIIPSYLYQEYSNDDTLQAFVSAQNGLTQGYLDWFNTVSLGVYTSPMITGGLLDWTAAGIYNITRPTLSTENVQIIAGFNSTAFNTVALNASTQIVSGTAVIASDDIYKRVLTWNLYRGDGMVFTLGWLKNRVARFINGANGSDCDVLDNQPDITVSNGVFNVSATSSQAFTDLQLAYNNGALAFPFQYSISFTAVSFLNNGGLLQLSTVSGYPTSPTGLAAGAVWYNGGTVAIVPGGSGTGQTLYFATETPTSLLASGAGGIPTADPLSSGELWNDGGLIAISAG